MKVSAASCEFSILKKINSYPSLPIFSYLCILSGVAAHLFLNRNGRNDNNNNNRKKNKIR